MSMHRFLVDIVYENWRVACKKLVKEIILHLCLQTLAPKSVVQSSYSVQLDVGDVMKAEIDAMAFREFRRFHFIGYLAEVRFWMPQMRQSLAGDTGHQKSLRGQKRKVACEASFANFSYLNRLPRNECIEL